ncbi:MAG: 4-hydroxy-tetrahydrodipicolinate synthase [Candidatus Geothermincolia bacterium]
MNTGLVKGCLVPVVTPFDAQGGVDEAALAIVNDFLIDEQAADAIIPCGTTGESPTLSHAEHLRVIEATIEQVAGRVPVIAGTGSNSTAEAIEMTRQAEELGVDGCLLVGPYYNRPTQEGIYRHFRAIAESTSLPLILYNIPARTGRNIEPETVLRLAEIPNIVGIKEASGDIGAATRIISDTRDSGKDFYVYSGEDALTYHILCLGGHGCVAAVGHVIGREFGDMCRMVWEGRLSEAQELHFKLLPLVEALFCEPNPTAIKQALSWMGLPAGTLRLPLLPLSERGQDVLRAAMIRLGKMDATPVNGGK